MGPEVQNSFKEVSRGDQYGKLTVRHQGFRNYVSPNQTHPVFCENVISSPGGPKKNGGTNLHVKSKKNWGLLSTLFSIFAIKRPFCQYPVIFYPPIILAVNWQKMHFNGQNRKKWRKRTPIIFWFYTNVSPNFFWGSPGLRKWHFLKKWTCLIWRNISTEPLTCPEWKNIGPASGPIH